MVSVIIPNFNHEKYLKQRISSVLEQTFDDFELIILDDKSTDNSVKVIAEYVTHPKVSKVVLNEHNSGNPFIQWVAGIKACKGEYIWIAESDDYADKTFLSKLIDQIKNEPEVVLAYSDSVVINENNIEVDFWSKRRNAKFKTQRWSDNYSESGKSEIKNFLIYGTTINNASCALIKREAIDEQTLEELLKFSFVGDWFLYLNVLIKGRVLYFAEPLSYYREHQYNTTKKSERNGLQFEETIKIYSSFIRKYPELSLKKSDVNNYMTYRFNLSLNKIEFNKLRILYWVLRLIITYPFIMGPIMIKWVKYLIVSK